MDLDTAENSSVICIWIKNRSGQILEVDEARPVSDLGEIYEADCLVDLGFPFESLTQEAPLYVFGVEGDSIFVVAKLVENHRQLATGGHQTGATRSLTHTQLSSRSHADVRKDEEDVSQTITYHRCVSARRGVAGATHPRHSGKTAQIIGFTPHPFDLVCQGSTELITTYTDTGQRVVGGESMIL